MEDDSEDDSELPSEDDGEDSDSDGDEGLDPYAVPPEHHGIRWDPIAKLKECMNRAVQLVLGKTSLKKYVASWGYTRPCNEKGAPRKKRRKEDGTFLWEKDVGAYVHKARNMFTTHPSDSPRGSAFTLAIVVCFILQLLCTQRPDLLKRGTWSPNGGGASCPFGFMLWMDGRKFASSSKPPYGLRRYREGHTWYTNNEACVLRFLDVPKPHKPLFNVLFANFFCEETVDALDDICHQIQFDEQVRIIKEWVHRHYGVGCHFIVCGDLHLLRVVLRKPVTGCAPFAHVTLPSECSAASPLHAMSMILTTSPATW